MNRRELLRAAAAASAVAGLPFGAARSARAADWPTKPLRAIVPYAPGSATDVVPRTVFEVVANQIGQPIVVENRPGGGTTIGAGMVAKSDPDGHTILIHSNALVTVPAIQANVPYDPIRDFSA